MREIDWSKAPQWATGYGLVIGGFGIEEVWFDAEQYLPFRSQEGYGPFPFGGGTGPERHNETMANIKFQQHRPVPWTGEGLPPVGEIIEWLDGEFLKAVVVGHHQGAVVAVDDDDPRRVFIGKKPCYRPLRTPEQIAAEERLHNVRNACTAIADTLDSLRGKTKVERAALAVVEAMIDAGYAKGNP